MSAETDHILDVFALLLDGPTGDGKNKRDAGLKEHWSIDKTHLRKGIGHVNKYLHGENTDADSGCHPLVHAAWRFLAVAYQDLAAAGKAPAPPHPLAEVVGQREFWRDVEEYSQGCSSGIGARAEGEELPRLPWAQISGEQIRQARPMTECIDQSLPRFDVV